MTDWYHEPGSFVTVLVYHPHDDRDGVSAGFYSSDTSYAITEWMMCPSGVAAELGISTLSLKEGDCIEVRIDEQEFKGSQEFDVMAAHDEVAATWETTVANKWRCMDMRQMYDEGFEIMHWALRWAQCETPECNNRRPSWRDDICADCHAQLEEERTSA